MAALICNSWPAARDLQVCTFHLYRTALYSTFKERPNHRILIFIENNHLVGYVMANLLSFWEDELNGYEIEKLYVQEHFQGKGIGRALLSEMATRYRGTFWLSTLVHNEKANGFYKDLGFMDIGITDFQLEGESHKFRVLAIKSASTPYTPQGNIRTRL